MLLNGLYLYSTGTVLECTTELGCITFYTKVHAIQYSSKVRAPLAGIFKSFTGERSPECFSLNCSLNAPQTKIISNVLKKAYIPDQQVYVVN